MSRQTPWTVSTSLRPTADDYWRFRSGGDFELVTLDNEPLYFAREPATLRKRRRFDIQGSGDVSVGFAPQGLVTTLKDKDPIFSANYGSMNARWFADVLQVGPLTAQLKANPIDIYMGPWCVCIRRAPRHGGGGHSTSGRPVAYGD